VVSGSEHSARDMIHLERMRTVLVQIWVTDY
jgi:hypothetical protein